MFVFFSSQIVASLLNHEKQEPEGVINFISFFIVQNNYSSLNPSPHSVFHLIETQTEKESARNEQSINKQKARCYASCGGSTILYYQDPPPSFTYSSFEMIQTIWSQMRQLQTL